MPLQRYQKDLTNNLKKFEYESRFLEQGEQRDQYKDIESQEWSDIDITKTTAVINKTCNSKAPGIDGIAHFWIKNLPSIHVDLTRTYNNAV